MIRLLVLYGHPKDPAAFDRYYREAHIPIAKKMHGLKKWTVGKVLGAPGGGGRKGGGGKGTQLIKT